MTACDPPPAAGPRASRDGAPEPMSTIDGSPPRRPDRRTLETLGAAEMLAHLGRRSLVAPARA